MWALLSLGMNGEWDKLQLRSSSYCDSAPPKCGFEGSESVNVESMSESITIAGIETPKADWDATC